MDDLVISMEKTFIDPTVFENQVKDFELNHTEPLPWSDVPIGTIFKIVGIERINFDWGNSYLVTATDIFDVKLQTWAPRQMISYIRDNWMKGRQFYFQSGG